MDVELLNYFIAKKFKSKEKFFAAVGIKRDAFYRHIKGISKFKLDEVYAIVKTLNLKSPDILNIFFAEYVE